MEYQQYAVLATSQKLLSYDTLLCINLTSHVHDVPRAMYNFSRMTEGAG